MSPSSDQKPRGGDEEGGTGASVRTPTFASQARSLADDEAGDVHPT